MTAIQRVSLRNRSNSSRFFVTKGAAAAKADPYVGKAQTQLWTALHKAFVGGATDAATADSYLTVLVPDAADRAEIIQLWETEQNIGKLAGPPA